MEETNLNGYLVPNLTAEPQTEGAIGEIGLLREKFLQENHSLLYDQMLMNDTLYSDLKKTENSFWAQVEQTMHRLLQQNPPPDKQSLPVEWAAHMNALKNQAQELAMPIVTSL